MRQASLVPSLYSQKDSHSVRAEKQPLNAPAHLYQRGNLYYFRYVFPDPVPQAEMLPPVEVTPAPLFSEAIERYVVTKLSDGAWKEHSLPDHRQRLGTFLEIIGDKRIDDISREDMREFRETLRRLPPNRSRSRKYVEMSIREILADPPEKTLSVKTINVTVEAVGSLLEWCVREGLLRSNPAKGLQIKDTRQEIELRDAFTADDLKTIFSHPKFTQRKFKYPAYFWIPLIGLYTGMRLEEIRHHSLLLFTSGVYFCGPQSRDYTI